LRLLHADLAARREGLEIVPSAFDKSWASPPSFAQQNVAGSGSSGTVFVLDDADTAALDIKPPIPGAY
jgi:hypothetical protein